MASSTALAPIHPLPPGLYGPLLNPNNDTIYFWNKVVGLPVVSDLIIEAQAFEARFQRAILNSCREVGLTRHQGHIRLSEDNDVVKINAYIAKWGYSNRPEANGNNDYDEVARLEMWPASFHAECRSCAIQRANFANTPAQEINVAHEDLLAIPHGIDEAEKMPCGCYYLHAAFEVAMRKKGYLDARTSLARDDRSAWFHSFFDTIKGDNSAPTKGLFGAFSWEKLTSRKAQIEYLRNVNSG